MIKLIGSTTSPFVRKVRLLLEGQDYEFETLKALSPEGSKLLGTYGPIKRIPILIIDGKTLFDSSIISEYLLSKKSVFISVDEKLVLKMIDELCDSCISLFQQKLWEIDSDWKNEQSTRMLQRANAILVSLDELQARNKLSDLQKDWLFCVLDWLKFRSVIKWDSFKNLLSFYNESITLEKYIKTRPSV